MTTQCKLCGKDINPFDVSSWKEVTGFVGGPKKDSMVLRTDTGAYACTPCVKKAKEGQAPDQESIFDGIQSAPSPVSWTEKSGDPIEDLEKFLDDGIGGE